MGSVTMKSAFALLFLLSPVAFAAGPEFQHKDPIIQQEFENAYKDIRSVLPVTGNAKCIDSPTFCVDTTNHRVGVANATPSTLLHLSSGTLTIDGTAPGIAVGGSTFTVTGGNVGVGVASPSSPLEIRHTYSATSSPSTVLSLFTGTSGTAATGMGPRIFFETPNSSAGTVPQTAAGIGGVAESVSAGSEKTALAFYTTTSAGSGTVTERARITQGGQLEISDGSLAAPGLTFTSDPDTGLYHPTTNAVALSAGGSQAIFASASELDMLASQTNWIQIDASVPQINPRPDNVWSLGRGTSSPFRWTSVWATNGTIQTSSSKLKRQIREIQIDDSTTTLVAVTSADISTTTFNAADDPNDVKVPRGIVFKWRSSASTQTANADMIGFLGDDLPQEAHALLPDGTRDPENFYTSAVVGIQSAAIRALQKRVRLQARQLRRLAIIVSELETQLNVTVPDPDPGATQ